MPPQVDIEPNSPKGSFVKSLSLYNFEQVANPFTDFFSMTPVEHGLRPPKQKELDRVQSTTSISSTRKAKTQM